MTLCSFTRKEVQMKLASAENTSPGPDGITYANWRSVDPEAVVLTLIINIYIKYRKIPEGWKNTMTVLIPKKERINEIGDVRPITLMNTSYKLLMRCLAQSTG